MDFKRKIGRTEQRRERERDRERARITFAS